MAHIRLSCLSFWLSLIAPTADSFVSSFRCGGIRRPHRGEHNRPSCDTDGCRNGLGRMLTRRSFFIALPARPARRRVVGLVLTTFSAGCEAAGIKAALPRAWRLLTCMTSMRSADGAEWSGSRQDLVSPEEEQAVLEELKTLQETGKGALPSGLGSPQGLKLNSAPGEMFFEENQQGLEYVKGDADEGAADEGAADEVGEEVLGETFDDNEQGGEEEYDEGDDSDGSDEDYDEAEDLDKEEDIDGEAVEEYDEEDFEEDFEEDEEEGDEDYVDVEGEEYDDDDDDDEEYDDEAEAEDEDENYADEDQDTATLDLSDLYKLGEIIDAIDDLDSVESCPPEIRSMTTSFGESDIARVSYFSFSVDQSITMGDVDEEKKAAIQPALKVLGNIAELIDTTDDIFSFKYYGLVRHRAGIEAWTKQLVLESYPAAKDVKMLTNRSRDRRDF